MTGTDRAREFMERLDAPGESRRLARAMVPPSAVFLPDAQRYGRGVVQHRFEMRSGRGLDSPTASVTPVVLSRHQDQHHEV